jgi:phage tail sheath protein FI
MHDLFRQGAFQGQSPQEAYFVKCDSTTTTPSDIDRGIVNIIVGFAPLKPAEFIVLYIQQTAGQPVYNPLANLPPKRTIDDRSG